jgi:hypothetical protein
LFVHKLKESIDLRHSSPPDLIIIYWGLLFFQAPNARQMRAPKCAPPIGAKCAEMALSL